MVCLGARKEGREDNDVSLSKTRDHDCVNFSIQSNRTPVVFGGHVYELLYAA